MSHLQENGSRRRRVLFVAEGVTLAHVARTTVLAGSLDPTRFEVHLAWDSRYNHLLGRLPGIFHPISSLPSQEFLRRLSRGLPLHDIATLRDYVREDMEVLDRVSPDVVVGDFRLSLAVSARLAGTPHIAVANAYWSPYGNQSFFFDQYDYPMSKMLGRRVAQHLFRLFRSVGFAAHTRPLNRLLREQSLPAIGSDIRVMYTLGDYTAYTDIPGLVQTRELPDHHRIVGAALWSPDLPLPAWWHNLPSDRPVVYCTLGSSGDSALLQFILDSLADLPVVVLAATADRAQVERTPTNAWVTPFLPGSEASARASLVICNGGSPTTYQALAAGTPILGVCSNNMDQHLNMEAVRRSGSGEVMAARRLDRYRLQATVSSMLDTASYAECAGAVAIQHQACLISQEFPALVEKVLRAR